MEMFRTFPLECALLFLLLPPVRDNSQASCNGILSVGRRWRKSLGAGMRLTLSFGSAKEVPVCVCMHVCVRAGVCVLSKTVFAQR